MFVDADDDDEDDDDSEEADLRLPFFGLLVGGDVAGMVVLDVLAGKYEDEEEEEDDDEEASSSLLLDVSPLPKAPSPVFSPKRKRAVSDP